MKSVFIIDGEADYTKLFKSLGFKEVYDMTNADLVCFTGGGDVTPSFYGDLPHHHTWSNAHRDIDERHSFNLAQEFGIPCVGICRGAQFLNVMSGGRMYQDVSEHTHPHFITDAEHGNLIYVSSTHHQMMMPGADAQLVAFGNEGGKREWYDGQVAKKDVSDKDIEVVFYEETKSLCFQPHPEFESVEYIGMRQYFSELLERFFGLGT